jgi:broad specificity phosphatase PhoE
LGHPDDVAVIQVVFETHSISEDNEREVASGWSHSRLSPRGRELARELGQRRGRDGIDAVFSSDLRRAAETAEIAFTESDVPILLDWRLRECDYGELNGRPLAEHPGRGARFLDEPYPGGESWRQAVTRVGGFLDDLPTRWTGKRVLVIGHVATRWGLDHYLARVALAELVYIDFNWREGWEYILEPHTAGADS